MIFGIDVREFYLTGFDQLNNPYFEFAMNLIHSTHGYMWDLELEYCSEEYIDRVMEPQMKNFYFQNICIKNREEASLHSNIWTDFNSSTITYHVLYC